MDKKFVRNILKEKKFDKKVTIISDNKEKLDIFFDNTIIYKAFVAKIFMDTMEIDVDRDLVVTGMMLCGCKKINNSQDISKLKIYAKESADHLREIGFPEEFCVMCEHHNRYGDETERKKESDILEIVDQFAGMLLDRPERVAFPIEEALILLETRNLKKCNNIYLEEFKKFITIAKEIKYDRFL